MASSPPRAGALNPSGRKHKVTVIGSGNWGSTIAKVVAENTAAHPDLFERDVQMWVYEEQVQLKKDSKHYKKGDGLSNGPQKLTTIINTFHENVKYLPGIALPHNIIANPDVADAVHDSTILIFNLPHQFIKNVCKRITGHIMPFARGISCIKGIDVQETSVHLFSETIGHDLGIYCGALSGANIASEVAQEKWSETTIAYDPPAIDSHPSTESDHVDPARLVHTDVHGQPYKVELKPLPADYPAINQETVRKLFHRRYFHVSVVSDVASVSLGGALKNVVAVAAGWVDGLGWGDNAKAAIMRIGLLEMVSFGKRFFSKTVSAQTFTEESAGVADLITTCNGGRHNRCAAMSIREGKPIGEIEARELNGQKLQGTLTAYEIHTFLKSHGIENDYPLFTAVYDILEGKAKAEDLPAILEPDSNGNTNSKSGLARRRLSRPTSSQQESILIPAPALASSRYNRQLLIPHIGLSGQQRLSQSSVLIVGLGGLGSPAALYLASAGIGKLGFVDGDRVEESNLHRQIVHAEGRVGLSKVSSAMAGCKGLNSTIEYEAFEEHLHSKRALQIIEGYDVVLDCTDNPATRYLISDACVVLGKTLVSGAAQVVEGQMMTLVYPYAAGSETMMTRAPCYRCIFPRPPPPEMVRGCSEIGILGPVVGALGTLMATEAIKVIAQGVDGGYGRGRKPTMLLYNAWSADAKNMFRTIGLRGRRSDCVACGDEGVLREKGVEKLSRQSIEDGRIDYVAFCGGPPEDVKLLTSEQRMSASEFIKMMESEEGTGAAAPTRNALVVDVREETEFEMGTKVKGSVNIPISKILRDEAKSFKDAMRLQEEEDDNCNANADADHNSRRGRQRQQVYFICQRGNDSQIAAQKLIDLDQRNGNLPLPSNHGGPYTGDLTYYAPGLGACGVTSSSSEDIVAVSHTLFDAAQSGTDPNANPLCGKKIRAKRYKEGVGERSVDLTVVDRCVGCKATDIDVTTSAFDRLADLDLGRVTVSWSWLD
ncbi:hypothetical protein DV736_g6548, partial [Chaetothyriales sp. CBS 134916]